MPMIPPTGPEPLIGGILNAAGGNAYPDGVLGQGLGPGRFEAVCQVSGRYFLPCAYTSGGAGVLLLSVVDTTV